MGQSERDGLKRAAHRLEASVNVGKAGVTPAILKELSSRLEREGTVKVRLLPASRGSADRSDLAAALARGSDAELVEVRGNTVVLHRPRRAHGP